jgi:PPOX class probable F420-dependent enzyme
MTASFNDRVRKVLDAPNLAVVTTVGASGAPCAQPTWFDTDGETLRINTQEGRAWPERVRRDPRVSICVVNAAENTEYVEVRGRVVEETTVGAIDHIDSLSHKYLGVDYPNHFAGEVRTIFRVEPEKVVYVNLLEAIPAVPPADQR